MKYTKTNYSIFMLIAMLVTTSLCFAASPKEKTSIKEVKQETQDLIQALQGYTADQRDEAVQRARAALKKLDERIDALETRIDENWDQMNKAAREKARANLRTLRKQRNEVAEWYGSLKTSSAEAWEHMKKGFSDAYKALGDAWEKSEKEFGADN
ncbi:MAG: hypothetical protein K9L59_05005 [Desulfobacterales bacterium]|nr:hypothetical protein [Desulfobacterales bacterium]